MVKTSKATISGEKHHESGAEHRILKLRILNDDCQITFLLFHLVIERSNSPLDLVLDFPFAHYHIHFALCPKVYISNTIYYLEH